MDGRPRRRPGADRDRGHRRASPGGCSPGARPSPGPFGRIALELAASGFGTAVGITAEHSRPDPAEAIAALEDLLDELGSPERRPFAAA